MKTARTLLAGLALACLLAGASSVAGVLDPDCTAEKAAKSAVAKATVGVDGRCKPAETVKDSGKRAIGADDSKNEDDESSAKKTLDEFRDD